MPGSVRDAVVSGLGAVSALAAHQHALWEAVEAGRDGIAFIRRFPTDGFAVQTGAIVTTLAEPDTGGRPGSEGLSRSFSLPAAREAMEDARLSASGIVPERLGFVFGTGLNGDDRPIHCHVEELARELGLLGPCITISTACSSSTNALGIGRHLLAMGAADAVVCGGADVLSPEVFAGFHALGVLSPEKCAPFSVPVGTTLGEGAGFLILEHAETAARRGARIRARISGYGISGDAFHETSPDPTGSGVERALGAALADAALSPEDIGYVNVHGSGTEANDPSEWRGIQRGLGPRASVLPVSSTKGALGHAQGAAGVLEAIVTILAMEHEMVPPTLHFSRPRPHGPADPVGEPAPRPWSYRHAISLNAAFGGSNAAVVLSRPDTPPAVRTPRSRRPVAVHGVGLVGPFGLGVDAFLSAPAGAARLEGRVPPFPIDRLVRTADSRGLDPVSRFLTAAAALALRDAAVPLRGDVRDHTGLFVGAVSPSTESRLAFRRSIDERGLQGVSAAAFARIVLNAATGFCSKLLSLRGPLCTFSTGAGSGLAAVALAAEFVSTRTEVDWMIAGGADEFEVRSMNGAELTGTEGAAAVALGPRDAPRGPGAAPPVPLVGWGLAGPGRLPEAVDRARAMAPTGSDAVPEQVFREEDWTLETLGLAAPSALACAAAVLALRRAGTGRALVTSNRGDAASVALCLSL